MAETVKKIHGKILDYQENVIHDSHIDGGFFSADATILELIETCDRSLRIILVAHSEPEKFGSIWREVGRVVVFEAPEKYLCNGGNIIFSSTIKLLLIE